MRSPPCNVGRVRTADITFLVKRLRALLADVTFLEAFERTGRMLNVTVTAADTNEPPRMLNYLTAPHVIVWSAVAASSAFPGLFPAQELYAKDNNGKFVKCAHCRPFRCALGLPARPAPLRSSPSLLRLGSPRAGSRRRLPTACDGAGTTARSKTTCRSGSSRSCSTSTTSL